QSMAFLFKPLVQNAALADVVEAHHDRDHQSILVDSAFRIVSASDLRYLLVEEPKGTRAMASCFRCCCISKEEPAQPAYNRLHAVCRLQIVLGHQARLGREQGHSVAVDEHYVLDFVVSTG